MAEQEEREARRGDVAAVATRIERAARAMFEQAHPGRAWDDECKMLSGSRRAYSLAPDFRRMADAALAADRAELAGLREELDRERSARDRSDRLLDKARARAEKAEARLSWLESDEAVERAARVLARRFEAGAEWKTWSAVAQRGFREDVKAVRDALLEERP